MIVFDVRDVIQKMVSVSAYRFDRVREFPVFVHPCDDPFPDLIGFLEFKVIGGYPRRPYGIDVNREAPVGDDIIVRNGGDTLLPPVKGPAE